MVISADMDLMHGIVARAIDVQTADRNMHEELARRDMQMQEAMASRENAPCAEFDDSRRRERGKDGHPTHSKGPNRRGRP